MPKFNIDVTSRVYVKKRDDVGLAPFEVNPCDAIQFGESSTTWAIRICRKYDFEVLQIADFRTYSRER